MPRSIPSASSTKNTRALLRDYYRLGRSPLDWGFLEQDCCRVAFLRGLFLAYGSMASPEKEYHLEINALTPLFAEELYKVAESCGIRFKVARRKGSELLYLKESEQIEDFLTLIGAPVSSMRLMEVKVMKTVRNHVNRTTNCETANLNKTVFAAASQVQGHPVYPGYGGAFLPGAGTAGGGRAAAEKRGDVAPGTGGEPLPADFPQRGQPPAEADQRDCGEAAGAGDRGTWLMENGFPKRKIRR